MNGNKIKNGKIIIEIRVLSPEKVLNILWAKGINIYNVKKKNVTTIRLEIDYANYSRVYEVVTTQQGKISVIGGKGLLFVLGRLKRKSSLVIGGLLFLLVLYGLSNYIWAIEIDVQKNIAPFEIRQQLKSIGITPGILKSKIEVSKVEKKLENLNSEILWLRVRIEGSTLKVKIEEKINPPTEWIGNYGNLVAKQQGQIKRVYTFAGKSVVQNGSMVNSGQILIKGIDGMEGQEYLIQPRGIVIANTFYEKEMVVKTKGTSLERSGEKDNDVYITLFGKKLYIKKAIKDFKHYDRIEKSGKILSEVLYYERVEKNISITEEEATAMAIKELENSLLQSLPRDAKVVDKIVTKQLDSEGKLNVKVVFVVEQNILNDIPVAY